MFCVCHLLFSLLFCFELLLFVPFFPKKTSFFFADRVVFVPYLAFGFLSLRFELGRVFLLLFLWELLHFTITLACLTAQA